MKYSIAFFIAVLLMQGTVHAQEEETTPAVEEYAAPAEAQDYESDQGENEAIEHTQVSAKELVQKKGSDVEPLQLRRFDEKKWNDIVGATTYSAEDEARRKKQLEKNARGDGGNANGKSAQDQSKKRVKKSFNNDDDYEEQSAASQPMQIGIPSIVGYIVVIAIVAVILYLVCRNASFNFKSGKVDNPNKTDYTAPVEDIRELEIDRLIREATASGDYRLVIRVYFLGLLQALDEHSLIVWKKDKTNRDYLYELFSKPNYYADVKTLTNAYEQVWYGEHTFSKETYAQLIASFKAVNQKIKPAFAR